MEPSPSLPRAFQSTSCSIKILRAWKIRGTNRAHALWSDSVADDDTFTMSNSNTALETPRTYPIVARGVGKPVGEGRFDSVQAATNEPSASHCL